MWIKGLLIIENMPASAMQYKYIIAKAVEGKVYYFGADNDVKRAEQVAKANDGFVFVTACV